MSKQPNPIVILAKLSISMAQVDLLCESTDYNEGRHDAYLNAIYTVADAFGIDPFPEIDRGRATVEDIIKAQISSEQ